MTAKQAIFAGVLMGFLVSCIVLALLWSGVAGVLIVNKVDLMYLLWPSSLMLLVGWNRTVLGITVTLMSIAINCLLYGGAAYLLRMILLGSWGRKDYEV